MYDCPNCGMMPFACVCVPWCHEHDRERPCAKCAAQPRAEVNVPLVVMIGVVVSVAGWFAWFVS